MSNPFDFFDKIYCINLDHRTDRWESAQNEFDKLGIADRVKRISAVNREDVKAKYGDKVCNLNNPKLGQLAVTESSRKCIDDAVKRGAKNCLTFQDDVCFRNYDADFFREALNELPDDWETLFLGYECWKRRQLKQIHSERLLRIEKFWMAQAVANNTRVFDILYSDWDKIPNPPKYRGGNHEELLWDYNNYGLRYEKRFAFQLDNENDSDINDGKMRNLT
jgi:GR25 family glycosyltransferase involved in LPS biosynthesis